MIILYRRGLWISMFMGITTALACFGLEGTSYAWAALLPIAYVLAATLLLIKTWQTGPSLFLLVTLPLMFLRYVAFPALVLINGGYEGRSWIAPAESSFDTAIFLMTYELVAVTVLIAWLEPRHHRRKCAELQTHHTLPRWYVFVMVMFAFALLALQPDGLSLINFLVPTVWDDENVAPALATFAAMLFMTVKTVLFVTLMNELTKLKNRGVALVLAILLSAVNIGIYFGTNRLAVLLTTFVTVWIFIKLFRVRSVLPILGLASVAFALISLVTVARDYVTQSDRLLENVADYIQGYVGGLYNVAIGVEVPLVYPEARSLQVLAFDFLRPMVGVNLLVQNLDVSYSNVYFNNRMWTNVERRSQIIPMIAQGNLFFTAAFAPVFSMLAVWLAYLLMRKLFSARYLEIKLFLILIIMRLGFFWGQNSMNIIGYISLNLIIPLCLMGAYFVLFRILRPEQRMNSDVNKQ